MLINNKSDLLVKKLKAKLESDELSSEEEITIIYGASHMQAVESSLYELGFELQDEK